MPDLFIGIRDERFSENMGMAAYQFFVQRIQNIMDVKKTGFPGQLGMKDRLEEQVPQFLPQVLKIPSVNRFQDFVCFFQQIGFQGIVGLLPVPGATVRPSQARHDFNEFLESVVSQWHSFVFMPAAMQQRAGLRGGMACRALQSSCGLSRGAGAPADTNFAKTGLKCKGKTRDFGCPFGKAPEIALLLICRFRKLNHLD
jgi:hypothetical protein